MSDAWLRGIIVVVIVLLVIYQVGVWVHPVFGVAGSMVSAALVAAVSFFAARMAGLSRRSNAWFVVPTLLFTVLPLGARSWIFLSSGESWWSRIVDFVPFLIGFPLPVLLLLVVYVELRNRAVA